MISSSSFYASPCPNGCSGQFMRNIKDTDGDSISICSYSGRCPYKKIVRDVDGDLIELCDK